MGFVRVNINEPFVELNHGIGRGNASSADENISEGAQMMDDDYGWLPPDVEYEEHNGNLYPSLF